MDIMDFIKTGEIKNKFIIADAVDK